MHEKKNCIIYVVCFELCRSLFSRRRRFLGLHRSVDQPNYMDVSNPDQAAGLVILIRPDTDVATANVQSLLKGQPFAQSSTNIPLYDFKEGGSYTFEIKKEDDKYVVLWNGKAMKTEFGAELDLSWRNGAFQNDKAYLLCPCPTIRARNPRPPSPPSTARLPWAAKISKARMPPGPRRGCVSCACGFLERRNRQ